MPPFIPDHIFKYGGQPVIQTTFCQRVIMADAPTFQDDLYNIAERRPVSVSQHFIEQQDEWIALELFDGLGRRKAADPVEMDRFIGGEQAVEHALLRAFRK